MIINKKKSKLTLVTNISLVCIFVFVFAVSMIRTDTLSVYGGKTVSPIYCGNSDKKNVSLMINVYENSAVVDKMIDLFIEKNVKVTFFVGGCWADDNGKLLNKMKDNAFEIGNHGYFHKDHKKLSYNQNKAEIENCSKIVKELCGVDISIFAPPSGSFCDDTLSACSNLGYSVIMWSKDTIDWRDSDVNKIYDRATKNAKNGDMILMHPKEHTLKVLPSIIDFYINNGFNIVTVGENIQGL